MFVPGSRLPHSQRQNMDHPAPTSVSHSVPAIRDIRRQFIDFFVQRGHEPVASSNLVPENDDTLLFTNSGMVQFKDCLLGLETRPYQRAVTSQKCLRVSGKHNDLDEVGLSPRHHTFFEMLGNFSFGDYFKREAIRFAWELIVEEWQLPPERLWFSVYKDDEEAPQYWREVGAHPDRILPFGRKDNWWSMGETGPCGPCSEIHYYWGDLETQHPDGVNRDDEYLEFWNLVFMQYDQVTPTELVPLPNPGVDTGAGLERVASILQHRDNTYDTDAFQFLMDRVQALAQQTNAQRRSNEVPYRVIADHARAIAFLIAEGILPGNEGPNYITRLILRRAARFGRLLGFHEPFMAQVVGNVIAEMGDHFQELRQRQDFICQHVTNEETRFLHTLSNGLNHLEAIIAENRSRNMASISGDQSFLLWDTFGFPLDLTRDLAREQDMTVDEKRFRELAAAARERSRQHATQQEVTHTSVYGEVLQALQDSQDLPATGVQHLLYEGKTSIRTRVLALLQEGQIQDTVQTGDQVEVVVKESPFYVEAGGQVSDTGTIEAVLPHASWSLQIQDVHRPLPGLIVHAGTVTAGTPATGNAVLCQLDAARREDIIRNHTATHLLHAELRRLLGSTVHQAGSLVAPDRLRFDFTFDRGLTAQEIAQVEAAIRQDILANSPVTASWEPYATAVATGAMALFGEKYGDVVRVIRIGDSVSQELCGGMHVATTAEVGSFHIVSEGSSAAGQRRIEAVTGQAAHQYVTTVFARQQEVATLLKTQPDMLVPTIQSLLAQNRQLSVELKASQRAQAQDDVEALLQDITHVDDVPCVLAEVEVPNVNLMREMCDRVHDRLGQGVVALGAQIQAKPQLVVAVSKSLASRGLHAGHIVRAITPCIEGGGGGRQNMAQAGGRKTAGIGQALAQVPEVAATLLDKGS